LRFNKIKEIPATVGNLRKLQELHLCSNKIKELPTEIKKLERLDLLELDDNPIGRKEVRKIKGLLPNCDDLSFKASGLSILQILFG
jgi:Leucine-rich repeat (LRR) protein